MSRIVVTGIGMINAVGLNKDEAFDNIIAGKTGIDRITHFDPEGFGSQIAGEVKGFDPKTIMDAKEVKKADRFIQLALAAAKEAMADSGLEDYNGERFGISAASGIGGLPVIEKASVIVETRGPRRISPFFIPSALVNMIGGFVSIEYGLKGPNLASVTACAAGTHAITEAYKTLKAGMADKMMVVAGEACICPVGVGGFAAMKALSTRNDDPKHASRPFDAKRDGFVMGEGGACLILEKYEDAVARGAKIYGEIIGVGESGDANHITTPAPGGEGAYRAMKMAYEMAGRPKIDYINAHGTSTKYNDLYETMAIKTLFGGKEKCPPVSSTKGATGHCLGAAGTIEAVITLMAMNKNILPPTINYEEPDPECDLDYVPNKAREAEIEVAMSNSFGFGGTNGVVIFKKVK
ncbi:beta-ketoacyl-ACP synthase II [Caminibacter pacificus]|jgi:3-oxoacyl-[acyl-carrier-protein] synthase II|uniref:3-oxoacyl-[acyl-carrier-protein] synthase 2 n=1 Tax=Caminibacter pacificus TaxID=1424653 RepID=A0AAJ4RCJ9_9BACT|nr:beta-ketoacyl-ACP synthase II [Caminibacter pacificus]NPA87943.1 beta-ketoacyl-ACP synthase II [Campylobacterota bacterium]QCI27864.1 beta-ketoacyl-ACP synthase II [Caminibacter pacificus]ROR39958.1 3-oxoacyl-[acyl-carrier-protein] synthase II [Caminibacter pacificus]